MGDIIPAYFSKDEKELQEKIIASAKRKHTSKSSWMKDAAAEKIEREENQSTAVKANPQGSKFNNLLDDL